MKEQWYHVVPPYPHPQWGFAAKDNIVTKSASSWMVGKTLQQIKPFFLEHKLKVYKL